MSKSAATISLVLLFGATLASAAVVAQSSPYSWACAASSSKRGCADSSCNTIQANIGGMVLVLSTGSMLRAPAGSEPQGSTPAECCNLCKTTDSCNAWVFCNKKGGCGSAGSCTSYVSSLSSSAATNSMQGLMPAAGFGRFGAGCNADGTWPYGTCSLKQVADAVNPPAFGAGEAAEGWVGGVTPKPVSNIKGCPAGLTEMTCRSCAATRNPAMCYTCMQTGGAWQGSAAKCVPCANAGSC